MLNESLIILNISTLNFSEGVPASVLRFPKKYTTSTVNDCHRERPFQKTTIASYGSFQIKVIKTHWGSPPCAAI